MLRKIHNVVALTVGIALVLLALSGFVLSTKPVVDRASVVMLSDGELSVADLAAKAQARIPGVEQITRRASGEVIVYFSNNSGSGANVINPKTAEVIGPYQSSAFIRWVKDFHRSFLLDDLGRLLVGLLAVLMVVICWSGVFLLVRRLGGWRELFKPMLGTGQSRLHSEIARLAVVGLLISAMSGSYLSAVRFGILAEPMTNEPSYPVDVAGGTPMNIGELDALRMVDVNDFIELVFPFPDDPLDVYSLTTKDGAGFVDQATGELLKYEVKSSGSQFYEWMVKIHTGNGLWWLSLILGVASLSVPFLTFSGVLVWWHRRKSKASIVKNTPPNVADTVILVGSESNKTWGFAKELQRVLIKGGKSVHCSAMNDIAAEYPQANHLFVLTSTYGSGDAPETAKNFLQKLQSFRTKADLTYAVLGFGDKQFSAFCKYAVQVDQSLQETGLTRLHDVYRIDRCSSDQFRDWGKTVGEKMGLELSLNHRTDVPNTKQFKLIERVNYGQSIGAPTSILRFKPVSRFGHPPLDFHAGDLLGVIPSHREAPRLYSLASSHSDGVVEICVRKQKNGLCSGLLHDLKVGDRIEGFIQPNLGFRPAQNNKPVILVGAGAGIGPLIGFIRQNQLSRPMFLFWGGRDPNSDFLYQNELDGFLKDNRLTSLTTAFSRISEGGYVQDAILTNKKELQQHVDRGAQILVCGGIEMAKGVRKAMESVVEPLKIDIDDLCAKGLYVEDVY